MAEDSIKYPVPLMKEIKIHQSPKSFGYPEDYNIVIEENGLKKILAYDYDEHQWKEIFTEIRENQYPKIKLPLDLIDNVRYKKKLEKLAAKYHIKTYTLGTEPDILFYYDESFEKPAGPICLYGLYKLESSKYTLVNENLISFNRVVDSTMYEESEISAKQFFIDVEELNNFFTAKELNAEVKRCKDFYLIINQPLNHYNKGMIIIPIDENYNFICWKIPFIFKVIFSKKFVKRFNNHLLLNYTDNFIIRFKTFFGDKIAKKILLS